MITDDDGTKEKARSCKQRWDGSRSVRRHAEALVCRAAGLSESPTVKDRILDEGANQSVRGLHRDFGADRTDQYSEQCREETHESLTTLASAVSSLLFLSLSPAAVGPPCALRAAAMMGDMAPIPHRCCTDISVLPSFSTRSPICAVMYARFCHDQLGSHEGARRTETRGDWESVMTQYLFQRSSRSRASDVDLKCEISSG